MKFLILSALLQLALVTTVRSEESEIPFDEGFVRHRAEAMKQLALGTDDAFFYRSLEAQLRGDLAAAAALLAAWEKLESGDGRLGRLKDRQLLLEFARDPKSGRAVLAERLGLDFDVAAGAAEKSAPAAEEKAAEKAAPAAEEKAAEKAAEPQGLPADFWKIELPLQDENQWKEWLVSCRFGEEQVPLLAGRVLKDEQRSWLLQQLAQSGRSDFPGLVDLILADMEAKDADRQRFGKRDIDKYLSLAQLQELGRRRPALREEEDWADAVVRRQLALAVTPQEQAAALEEALAFARPLPETQRELKLLLLQELIQVRERLCQASPALVEEYLALPRPGGWKLEEEKETDFQLKRAGLEFGRVTEDAMLWRQLRRHFAAGAREGRTDLRQDAVAAGLLKHVRAELLLPIYAEARLCGGCPDADAAAALLGQPQLKALKESSSLELLPDNPATIAVDAVPELHLAVRNAPELLLRIHKLDAAAACRIGVENSPRTELEGLQPAWQRRRPLDPSPLLRQELRVRLDELREPGLYAVDLIAGGATARAWIRKGELRSFVRDGAKGQIVAVLDGRGRPVAGARAELGELQFRSDAAGLVCLPYLGAAAGSDEESNAVLIVSQGGLATRLEFKRHQAQAVLAGGFEAPGTLIPGRFHPLACNARLEINGQPADPRALQGLRAELILAGPESRRIPVPCRGFDAQGRLDLQVPLPADFAGGQVKITADWPLEGGRSLPVEISTELKYRARPEAVRSFAFRRDGEATLLELRGANGEALEGEPVKIFFKGPFWGLRLVELKSDSRGRVQLGRLPQDVQVEAKWGALQIEMQVGQAQRCSYPAERALAAGEALFLPLPSPGLWQPALFRIQKDLLIEDLSAKLHPEGGELRLEGLEPGEYLLHLGGGHKMSLRVHAGERRGDEVSGPSSWSASPAPQRLPLLQSSRVEGDFLVLQCRGPARPLHISAGWEPTGLADGPGWSGGLGYEFQAPLSLYLDGGRLDEESQYILERGRHPWRAGVMLQRPGLLLNPRDATDSAISRGIVRGSNYAARLGPGRAGGISIFGGSPKGVRICDDDPGRPWFYAAEEPWQRSFVPDAQGQIRIPLAELGSRNLLGISCHGVEGSWFRELALPWSELARRDLRLQAGLAPDKQYGEHRELRLLGAGDAVELSDIGGSRHASFSTLAELGQALVARHPDLDLRCFAPLLRWPRLNEQAKLEFYRRNACHEVHLFLSRRDPEFFRKHIRPFLAQLLQPDFVDQALLGADLRPWLAPSRLQGLNPFETALLARSLQDPALLSLIQERSPGEIDLFAAGEAFEELFRQRREAATETLPPPPPPPSAGEEPEVIEDAPAFYEERGPVGEWLEAGYWRRPDRSTWKEIGEGQSLWTDFAAAPVGRPFLSPAFLEAGDVNSSLLALAVTDLPFEAPPPEIREGRLHAASPLLFAQSALRVDPRPQRQFPVLVDYYLVEDGRRGQAASSFARGQVYLAQVRVNNLGPADADLNLLMQVPVGSLPLGEATQMQPIRIEPYSSVTREIRFYFPAACESHGVHAEVSRDGAVLGFAAVDKIQALQEAPPEALDRWQRIAVSGSPQQVLQWLRDKPLAGEDLSLCARLMQDRATYLEVLTILRRRHFFDPELWSYSVLHQDLQALAEYLPSTELAESARPFFASPLLPVDDAASGDYLHRDFNPLINPRCFPLGGKRIVAHRGMLDQYRKLLARLSYKPVLEADDHLQLAYYLLLQDRYAEAAEELALAPRQATAAKIQRDLLQCHLLFAEEKPAEAARIAAAYREHPMLHWRQAFAEVRSQADEIAAAAVLQARPAAPARAQSADPAARAPALSAELRDGRLLAHTANIPELTLELHPVDVETLFSREPFQLLGGVSSQPPLSAAAAVLQARPAASGEIDLALPAEWAARPLLLQISGGGRREILSQLPHAFSTRLAASQGEIQVLDAAGKPMPRAYVKVYARRGGSVSFHKDGFTDLRGRFDYASLNSGLGGISEFAILVLSEKDGAAVLQARPPQR